MDCLNKNCREYEADEPCNCANVVYDDPAECEFSITIKHEMSEIIETLRAADNEATAAPYWLILDPKQNMSCGIYELAAQISGPFFCRKDAQNYLIARRHHYSDKARVFCHSGHFSRKYEKLCKDLGV